METKGPGLIWILVVSMVLSGCYKEERNQLQSQVDSLKWVLDTSQKINFQLTEIDDLLDSIDANRNVMRAQVVKDPGYLGYANRLRDLNFHIKDTQLKIQELEKASAKVKGLRLAVQNLQNELELQTNELSALQQKYHGYSTEIDSLVGVIDSKDSMLYVRDKNIKAKEADMEAFQASLQERELKVRMEMSELYYAQAQALEIAAERTNFAPGKKKKTLQDAIELYKISLSLGKKEAQERIDALEE